MTERRAPRLRASVRAVALVVAVAVCWAGAPGGSAGASGGTECPSGTGTTTSSSTSSSSTTTTESTTTSESTTTTSESTTTTTTTTAAPPGVFSSSRVDLGFLVRPDAVTVGTATYDRRYCLALTSVPTASITPGNAMGFDSIRRGASPADDSYQQGDRAARFARKHQMTVTGHPLMWYRSY